MLQNHAKIRPPLHASLNNSAARPSDQRCQKCVYIFIVTSGDRAEIQNGRICKVQHILNFSSDTRGHFFKCKHIFEIFGHLVQNLSYRFLKDGLATELLRKTCKGGLILQHECLVTLNIVDGNPRNMLIPRDLWDNQDLRDNRYNPDLRDIEDLQDNWEIFKTFLRYWISNSIPPRS